MVSIYIFNKVYNILFYSSCSDQFNSITIIVQTVKSFHSEIVSLNSKLERALDKKTLQTTSLMNENSRLKVQSSQLQSEIEERKSTIVEKNNHIQLLNEQY